MALINLRGFLRDFAKNFANFILRAFLKLKNQNIFVKTSKTVQELPIRKQDFN